LTPKRPKERPRKREPEAEAPEALRLRESGLRKAQELYFAEWDRKHPKKPEWIAL
jgi:hypothetical protein